LLACLRPLARKHLTPRITRTNVDSVVGAQGFVTADIDNVAAAGQVKLGAMYWSARSTSGAPIPEGTLVRVDRIEGVKVYVSPAEVGAAI
jgi:membrane protein implicated in regulation of membrane protease activity